MLIEYLTVFSLYKFLIFIFIHQKEPTTQDFKLWIKTTIITQGMANVLAYDQHKLSYENTPSYSGIKYYNALPLEFKSIKDFNIFEKSRHFHTLSKCLYSLNYLFL